MDEESVGVFLGSSRARLLISGLEEEALGCMSPSLFGKMRCDLLAALAVVARDLDADESSVTGGLDYR